MTIEITLLPISCRTLHKITNSLWKIVVNLFVWGLLIIGLLIMVTPRNIQEIFGTPPYFTNSNILLYDYITGMLFICAAICLMTAIYDIKINLCIKEKTE